MESLSARIKTKIINGTNNGRNVHIAILLKLEEEIRQSLIDGWTRALIWQTLSEEKKLSCSYSQFNRFVKRYLKDISAPSANFKNKLKVFNKAPEKKKPGFHYNPNYNVDDLV